MKITQGIMETAIYAEDLEACEDFYSGVFGLELVRKLPGKFVFLRAGPQMLLIFDPQASLQPDPRNPIPRHGATGPGHVCFRVADEAEVRAWCRNFAEMGIPVEQIHGWPDGGLSVYVRDPAGNSVEVADGQLWGLN